MTGIIPRRRDPREMMLLGLCLVSGLTFLAGGTVPSSVEAIMPDWLVITWYVGLIAAGTVGLTGNLWPGNFGTAVLIRISGQVLVAGPAAAYALAALVFARSSALFPAGLVLVFAVACLWTAKNLAEDLRRLRARGVDQ